MLRPPPLVSSIQIIHKSDRRNPNLDRTVKSCLNSRLLFQTARKPLVPAFHDQYLDRKLCWEFDADALDIPLSKLWYTPPGLLLFPASRR